MKTKYALYALLPALALGVVGANVASAHGMLGAWRNANPEEFAKDHQTMFETHASVLGISVDELKNAWAEGKTLQEIAAEKGISQEDVQKRMSEARAKQMEAQMKTLVEKGIITQDQASKRLEVMKARMQSGGKHLRKGLGRGMWF